MDKLRDIYVEIVSAVIIGVFLLILGFPDNKFVIVFGAILLLFHLGLLLFKIKPEKITSNMKYLGVHFSLILFILASLIGKYGLYLPTDSTYSYSFILCIFFLTLFFSITLLKNVRYYDKSFVGHAAHAVCFEEKEDKIYTYLILNLNHGLWLLPGGHLDIVYDEPYKVAKARVISELGYSCDII